MRRGWLVVVAASVLAGGVLAAVEVDPHPTPRTTATPTPTPEPTRTPLLGAATPGTLPTGSAIQRALARLLSDRALGRVSMSVVDADSGSSLLDLSGDRPATPASTTKIVTAAAALRVLGPQTRFTTRVLAGARGDVVLVGGGDPTLGGRLPTTGLDVARLVSLAQPLRQLPIRRVLVDDSFFSGPRTGPGWKPGYLAHGNIAPLSALAVDEGRASEVEGSARVEDPALAAGRQLAKLVGARIVVRGKAPAGAKVLATVQSPPVAELVEHMLTTSDNDLAEALGRQVALKKGMPATFGGEVKALASVVAGAAGLRDASGLSPQDRLSPRVLTAVLAAATHDELYAPLLAGLPVAGFDGTLQDRFRGSPAAGQVRAKTGTLSGVSALAGLVRTRDGRLLAFAMSAEGVASTARAQRALDRIAAVLAACGCA